MRSHLPSWQPQPNAPFRGMQKFQGRFAGCGLCVWVFTDLSWPDPGNSQPAGNQLPLNTFPGKIFLLGSSDRTQLRGKRQQKRQNQPSGDMQIFLGIFNKLKASVIVSYYCRNKSHYRDKGDLEASKNPSQSLLVEN